MVLRLVRLFFSFWTDEYELLGKHLVTVVVVLCALFYFSETKLAI